MLGDGLNHETNDYGGNDSHSGDVFEPELLDARIFSGPRSRPINCR